MTRESFPEEVILSPNLLKDIGASQAKRNVKTLQAETT